MKLVVFSDSHGSRSRLAAAKEMHPDADMFVFLGDGIRDAERVFDGCPFFAAVCGNCDSSFLFCVLDVPEERMLDIDGCRILCMHGHKHGVKFSLEPLKQYAKGKNADLVLYGHTHIPLETRDGGTVLFNPGSVGQGSYGIVYIEKGEILCSHGEI